MTRLNNVFDEIFYDLNVGNAGLWGARRSFSHGHPQIKGWSNLTGLVSSSGYRFIWVRGHYNQYILDENQRINITFDTEFNKLDFSLIISFPNTNEEVSFKYSYDVSSRILDQSQNRKT